MGKTLSDLIPKGKWICPGCGKEHKAPHFAHPGQIDLTRQPGNEGRVTFNRRQKDDSLDHGTKINHDLLGEADAFDKEGYQRPLFCPHCGWTDDWIIITRTGPLRGLIDQFLDIINGDADKISGREGIQQFMGFLKGKGIVK